MYLSELELLQSGLFQIQKKNKYHYERSSSVSSASSFFTAVIQLWKCTHAKEEVKFLQKEERGIRVGWDQTGIQSFCHWLSLQCWATQRTPPCFICSSVNC